MHLSRCARITTTTVTTVTLTLLVAWSNLPISNAFFQNLIPSMPKLGIPSSTGSSVIAPLLSELDEVIALTSPNGVADPSNMEQVKDIMIRIGSCVRPEQGEQDQRKRLPGTWELVYTTEKEINFFKTSWPFAKVSSITQRLDLYDSQIVENYIDFDGGGQFAVTGTVRVDDDNKLVEAKVQPPEEGQAFDRVAFSFTTATAVLWGKSISLPPTGAGWFDTMYCDDQYRLSRDSRGDYSVFRRIL